MAYGQTSFSDYINQLWLDGKKEEVLNIVQQRLQQNPDDMIGLILKMEYELGYLLIDDAQQTMNRVLEVGKTIKTKNFSAIYPRLEANINILQDALPNYPPEELKKDKAKINISGKPMTFLKFIIALEKDGWVDLDKDKR